MENSNYKAHKSYFDLVLIAFVILLIIGLILLLNENKMYQTFGLYISILMVLAIILDLVNLSFYKYEIKDNRLSINKGVFSKTNEEIDISNIVSVKISQSFLGRMFNFGDITVDVIGKSPVLLASINNPKGLKEALEAKMK